MKVAYQSTRSSLDRSRLSWRAWERVAPGSMWVFAAYLVLSAVTVGRGALLSPARSCVCGAKSPDPSQYMWSLAWWPHALLHGTNPLFTHSIWFPEGANIAAAATIPAAALAMWPVTAAFGPLVSYNVLAILSPALSALTAYLLCRRLTGDREASLVGGFLFGFNSYELQPASGAHQPDARLPAPGHRAPGAPPLRRRSLPPRVHRRDGGRALRSGAALNRDPAGHRAGRRDRPDRRARDRVAQRPTTRRCAGARHPYRGRRVSARAVALRDRGTRTDARRPRRYTRSTRPTS